MVLESRFIIVLSRQDVNIAFVGLNTKAQTACSEYLVHKCNFKRLDLDTPLRDWARRMYGYGQHTKLPVNELRKLYDSVYRYDNNIFLGYFGTRFDSTEADVVVTDVRYLNELEFLKNKGFHIVRVTSEITNKPKISTYIEGAEKGTVALSMMYDKSFARSYDVDYSLHFTNMGNLSGIMLPLLGNLGYKVDMNS